ncbi:MAG: hypothetical protein P9M00_02040 [Candidatus Tritonobacter lacicola]|nr:hypothetical protein [Candidatus Tritonobacter lacicola]
MLEIRKYENMEMMNQGDERRETETRNKMQDTGYKKFRKSAATKIQRHERL